MTAQTGYKRWDPRELAAALGYVAAFVALDWTSYVQPVLKLGITPWNPQDGLTLAVLLLFGARWVPIAAIAVLVSEVLVRHASPASGLVLGYAIWVAAGYGVLATILRRRGLNTPIRDSRSAVEFAGITATGTLVIAAGYGVLFVAAGLLTRAHSPNSLPSLWIGDLTGILTLTPLLMYAREWPAALRILRRRIWEAGAQFTALLLDPVDRVRLVRDRSVASVLSLVCASHLDRAALGRGGLDTLDTGHPDRTDCGRTGAKQCACLSRPAVPDVDAQSDSASARRRRNGASRSGH